MKSILLAAALPLLALGCSYSTYYYTTDRCYGVMCDVNIDCASNYCNSYYSLCDTSYSYTYTYTYDYTYYYYSNYSYTYTYDYSYYYSNYTYYTYYYAAGQAAATLAGWVIFLIVFSVLVCVGLVVGCICMQRRKQVLMLNLASQNAAAQGQQEPFVNQMPGAQPQY